jgi:endonuclease III
MDRQIKAEKAWLIPHELKIRLGGFDFALLASIALASPERLSNAMLRPTPLHRFPNEMSKNLVAAIQRIESEYGGNAAAIWSGRPSSATIVRRFLEFRGVGPKIASMAANILARELRVQVSDYYSIDISADVQVRRVFARMGFVSANASDEYLVFRARECNPAYPGIFDLVLWELGRSLCDYAQPSCKVCPYGHLCAHALQATIGD